MSKPRKSAEELRKIVDEAFAADQQTLGYFVLDIEPHDEDAYGRNWTARLSKHPTPRAISEFLLVGTFASMAVLDDVRARYDLE